MRAPVFFALLALAAGAVAVAHAQPTFTKVGDVVVSGIETVPTGIVADGDTAYVVGFAQRRVVSITGVTGGTPVVSLLARIDAADAGVPTPVATTTWQAGRGLLSVDLRGNELLIAGDAGGGSAPFDDGNALLIDATTGALIQQGANFDFGSPGRVGHGAFLGTSNIILSLGSGTNFFQANAGLTGLSGDGFYLGASGTTARFALDFVGVPGEVAGTDVYVSFNDRAFTGGLIGIHRYVDDAGSPDSFAGNTGTGAWYQVIEADGTHVGPIGGAGYLALPGGDEYIILVDRPNGRLHFVDKTNPANVFFLTDDIDLPNDVTVTTVGGEQFLLVTQTDDPSGNGRVSVYSIDAGPTHVRGWELY